uniref:Uncharacterized protein n=1 Tax=blood disease bacterium R229 TaxID=741978 RepID=G2ZT21_9RALS|nr:hypothetical protein BDB_30001 [blood disease bacterium R229]
MTALEVVEIAASSAVVTRSRRCQATHLSEAGVPVELPVRSRRIASPLPPVLTRRRLDASSMGPPWA